MTHYTRKEIIDIMYADFKNLIPKEDIEESLVRFSFISIASKEWLKEHYIDKQLSAKEIANLLSVSVGHVQKTISRFNLTKKKHGITTGNNQAHRRALWKKRIAVSQPKSKPVKIFHMKDENLIFVMGSITAAARKIKVAREHVRDCLNPSKPRKTAGGYRFEFIATIPKSTGRDSIGDIVNNFRVEDEIERDTKRIQYK